MTCGIYMIQNKVNGKIYIGQAVDIEDRWKNHKWELKGNRHRNKHLQRSWNRDGEDSFEFTIICECDENQLNTMEEYYIFELMTYNDKVGYNNDYGGKSGRPTEESRRKNREAHKGKKSAFYGKHHSEEAKKKLSEANKGENHPNYGKHLSEETKQKISESRKGEKNPMYGRTGEKNPMYGRTGEKNPNFGKIGIKCPNSIPIVQLTLAGEIVNVYGSAREAERAGFNKSHVNSCCIGRYRYKTHKGYKWMYLHEYISNMHPNIKKINLMGKTYEVNQEEVKIE